MMNNSLVHVIEVSSRGESVIRLLNEAEAASLHEMELEEFTYWRCDGKRRFWAYTYSEADIKRHGFNMTDQHSKDHGFHITDFVGLGNGLYEYYEVGFEQADSLVREFGSFIYFLPEYSWGSNGCELLPPVSNFENIVPANFVSHIASNDLVALAVTSNMNAFLYGYSEVANGIGSADVKAKAIAMGLINPTGELRPY